MSDYAKTGASEDKPLILRLYMDHHVHAGITKALRTSGVDVLTAYEDKHHEVDDPALLDRANALGRLLFSQDEDLLREAAFRQQAASFLRA